MEEQGDIWFTKLPEVLVCCRGLLDKSGGKRLCVRRVDACLCVCVSGYECMHVCTILGCPCV